MTSSGTPVLEPLEKPPLVEVASGFIFPSMPGLDPVALGTFWASMKERFPNREVRHLIEDVPGTRIFGGAGLPPLRTWLISADGALVLQVQHDRFLVNWRAVGPTYPRFSTDGGVLALAMEAFTLFSAHCRSELGTVPVPSAVEVLKVDSLEEGDLAEGKHWQGMGDALDMLSPVRAMLAGGPFGTPAFSVRAREVLDGCDLRVHVEVQGNEPGRVIRIETNARTVVGSGDLEAAFRRASSTANRVFSWLIPSEQRGKRFGGGSA